MTLLQPTHVLDLMVPPLALDNELLQFRYEEVVVLWSQVVSASEVEVQSANVYDRCWQRRIECDGNARKARRQHYAHKQRCVTHHGRWCGSVSAIDGRMSVVVTRLTADEARG